MSVPVDLHTTRLVVFLHPFDAVYKLHLGISSKMSVIMKAVTMYCCFIINIFKL